MNAPLYSWLTRVSAFHYNVVFVKKRLEEQSRANCFHGNVRREIKMFPTLVRVLVHAGQRFTGRGSSSTSVSSDNHFGRPVLPASKERPFIPHPTLIQPSSFPAGSSSTDSSCSPCSSQRRPSSTSSRPCASPSGHKWPHTPTIMVSFVFLALHINLFLAQNVGA